MNNKPFFIYSVAAGVVFIAMAVYVLFFNNPIKQNMGETKAYLLGAVMVAYGIFRIWRAVKMRNS